MCAVVHTIYAVSNIQICKQRAHQYTHIQNKGLFIYKKIQIIHDIISTVLSGSVCERLINKVTLKLKT